MISCDSLRVWKYFNYFKDIKHAVYGRGNVFNKFDHMKIWNMRYLSI